MTSTNSYQSEICLIPVSLIFVPQDALRRVKQTVFGSGAQINLNFNDVTGNSFI